MPADAPTSPVGRLGSGFQTTPGALQQTPANPASGPDAFVVRLKPQGAIDYAAYLGGSSQAWSDGIVVDALGDFTCNFPDADLLFTIKIAFPHQGANAFTGLFCRGRMAGLQDVPVH